MKQFILCLMACQLVQVSSLVSAPLDLHGLTDGADLVVVATFTAYEPARGWFQSGPVRHPGETFSVDVTDFGTIKIVEVLKGTLPTANPLPVLLPHQELVTVAATQTPGDLPGSVVIDPAVLKGSAEPHPLVGTTHLLFLQRMGKPEVDRGLVPSLPHKKQVYRWQTVNSEPYMHSANPDVLTDLRTYLQPRR